ncbi:ADP-ribose pyrophosphatase YjhB, NUDIX family [Seinonella peptonophila]|uniref:ADP-ribose pyrophosphatase YjhB, NUDIX family n=1 Tax=Seinonella peptonophila TaxID=112248 RepID=A0A1M4V834_9BACL|nr:NUDIX hydrolase [Seinonella peptonophila]SHE65151.1 ADP-ribose pyrophosphatase YjhB, NUDIX family [Seinonella peptonophila]
MKEISAGGVVVRRDQSGNLEILLIEDRYRKWTLPKGKQEPGETIEMTAIREVLEETGIQAKIIKKLDTIHYQYRHNDYGHIDKEVVYYLMETAGGQEVPQIEEINQVAWLSAQEAWKRLLKRGYANNHRIIRHAFQELEISMEEEDFT